MKPSLILLLAILCQVSGAQAAIETNYQTSGETLTRGGKPLEVCIKEFIASQSKETTYMLKDFHSRSEAGKAITQCTKNPLYMMTDAKANTHVFKKLVEIANGKKVARVDSTTKVTLKPAKTETK